MKTHFLSLLLLAIILVSSCSQEEIVQQQTVSLSDCKFIASFEQTESRTYLEDGKYLRWTANDELSVFMGKTLNRQFRFTGETGDNSGGFEEASSPGFVTGNDLDNPCHYAIYPYAKGTKITETGVLTVNLPSEQTYEENSFGCGANTMVAVTSSLSDMELSFKNACGYLKFKLYGDDVTVKSVTLQSNGEEKLSGSATLTAANNKNPSITMSSTASDMITLDCGTGVKIGSMVETATEFWFVVPPTTFESGFTVTIKDVNDNEFNKSTSKKISIERNVIKPISAFEVELVETIPNNQIWYTSSDGNVVTPYDTNSFGATITSNTYENGKGIITFDGEVTQIGVRAFLNNNSLTSIKIPQSVTSIIYASFSSCTSLSEIIIPNGVTKIYDNTFFGCTSLSEITIPDGVTRIDDYAFKGCNNLAKININASIPPTMGIDPFYSCSQNIKIYVPTESTQTYKASDYWKNFNINETGFEKSAIDLGLRVKWANYNLGANSPIEIGNYYAWGEIIPKTDFNVNNSTWWNVKYADLPLDSYGNLQSTNDAAIKEWGNSWRLPTQTELDELKNNCNWEYVTILGVKGYTVTSKTNGNSIFLPSNDSSVIDGKETGFGSYWSSTPCSDTTLDNNGRYAGAIGFYAKDYNISPKIQSEYFLRWCKRGIRPVYNE